MKKIFMLFAGVFLCLSVFAQALVPHGWAKVFDEKLDGRQVSFAISKDADNCYAFFYDEKLSELNMLLCDFEQYPQLKKMAFESKVLFNSVSTRDQYDKQKIYNKILDKFASLSKDSREDFDLVSAFGIVKTRTFFTSKLRAASAKKSLSKKQEQQEQPVQESVALEQKLKVWSFTDEVYEIIEKYYQKARPNLKIDYSLTTSDLFPEKLDQAILDNAELDVFTLESSFIRKYIEQGEELLLDLTDIYEEIKDKSFAYPFQIGSHKGKVYAMSWQLCPGAMFYRRSLAKKYLGTDDPAEVQKLLSDWNKFLETATVLSVKSDGKCAIVSSLADLAKPFLASRKSPWLVDGKLNIDPAVEKFIDSCKFLRDNGCDGKVGQWSEGWFLGMQDSLKATDGEAVEVFSYFLPAWGLHYVLKTSSPVTSGDWAMVQGPSYWYWGGTWLAASKNTKNPELARDFIKFICSDDTFLESRGKEVGDLVANKNVVAKLEDMFLEPYLSGQNFYRKFAEAADNVDGSLDQSYDSSIESLLLEAIDSFILGEKTKEEALSDFEKQVNAILAK